MRTCINKQFYKIRLGLRIQIHFCRIWLEKSQIRSYLIQGEYDVQLGRFDSVRMYLSLILRVCSARTASLQ